MSKIRILAIPSDNHGVGKYRILDPYKFIGNNFSEEVHTDIVFDLEDKDEVFNNYDIVVFHSFIHKAPAERNLERIKWLKSKGIKTIMDIDDFWSVDQRHPMYNQIKASKTPENKVEFMRNVDYVTCTTPYFADIIKQRLGLKNVHVFPNAIDENETQFKPNPIKSDLVRFGWLGGSSHFHDLDLMTSGIASTLNQYKDKTQFVLCGFDLRGTVTETNRQTGETRKRPIRPEETVWSQYEKIFTNNYKSVSSEYAKELLAYKQDMVIDLNQPYVRRWTEEINRYASNYNYFDVSLAPLVDTFFNGCKSQLKIIEAGFHKKAIIASETSPYNIDLISAVDQGTFNSNGNSLLVGTKKNHKDWAKHMKRLIDNPNMIEDLGNRLYESVKDKYSLKNVSTDRVQFFKTIL
jgi:glycosyltransferase involved in cell wall biosynthesis